eukprot:762604-Hanusia_phi.AAC.1
MEENARHMSAIEQKREELRARLNDLSNQVSNAEQDVIMEQEAQKRQRVLHQQLVRESDHLRRILLQIKKFERDVNQNRRTVEKAFDNFSAHKIFPAPRHKPGSHVEDEKENVSPTKAVAIRFDVERKKVQQACEDAIRVTERTQNHVDDATIAFDSYPTLMEHGILQMDHATMLQIASNLADRKAQEIRAVMDIDNMYEESRQRMQSERIAEKMRSLLYYAHREHLCSFEEVQTLRSDARNAQQRVESLVKNLESLHAKTAKNDAEWRIQAISMKQDRDLSAVKTKLEVIQGRVNEMKLKVRAHKQSSKALHTKHEEKKKLARQEKDLRDFLSRLISTSRKSAETLCSAHAKLLESGRVSLIERANDVEDMHIRVQELWSEDRAGKREDVKSFLCSQCDKVKKTEEGTGLSSGEELFELSLEDRSLVHLVVETKRLALKEEDLERRLAACQQLRDFVESSRSKPWNDDNYVHTLQASLDALHSVSIVLPFALPFSV